MKFFDKIFKKGKEFYKISLKQEENLVVMLALNKKVKLESKIFVPEGFCALTFSKEKLLDIIPSGEHELNAFTIQKACKANKLDKPTKKGYKKTLNLDFYFVNLNICKIKNKFYIKKQNKEVFFSLDFKIVDAKKFLKFLINDRVVFKDTFAQKFLTFELMKTLYYYILDGKFLSLEKLEGYVKSKLHTIGIECVEFNFEIKNQDETVFQEENEIKENEIRQNKNILQKTNEEIENEQNENLYRVNTTQSNEIKNNYENLKIESESDFDLNQSLNKNYTLVDLNDLDGESITYFVCECGAKLHKDSKMCYRCKKSFVEKNCCEYCGKEIQKNTYVCPYCKSVLIGN